MSIINTEPKLVVASENSYGIFFAQGIFFKLDYFEYPLRLDNMLTISESNSISYRPDCSKTPSIAEQLPILQEMFPTAKSALIATHSSGVKLIDFDTQNVLCEYDRNGYNVDLVREIFIRFPEETSNYTKSDIAAFLENLERFYRENTPVIIIDNFIQAITFDERFEIPTIFSNTYLVAADESEQYTFLAALIKNILDEANLPYIVVKRISGEGRKSLKGTVFNSPVSTTPTEFFSSKSKIQQKCLEIISLIEGREF